MAIQLADQIIYAPNHQDQTDVEYGFVTKLHENGREAYCRFWSKDDIEVLRTTEKSELRPIKYLYESKTVAPKRVRHAIEDYNIELG